MVENQLILEAASSIAFTHPWPRALSERTLRLALVVNFWIIDWHRRGFREIFVLPRGRVRSVRDVSTCCASMGLPRHDPRRQ